MGNVKTEGQWIGGQWVPTHVSKGGADANDTSATQRERLGNVSGLAGAAAAQKTKPKLPYRRDFPEGADGDAAYQKAYDAYMGKGKPKTTSSLGVIVVPGGVMEPMGQPPMMAPAGAMPSVQTAAMDPGMDPSALAQQMAADELRRRYGAMVTLGPLYGGMS